MAFRVRRKNRNPQRKLTKNNPSLGAPAKITSIESEITVLYVIFDQPVVVNALPSGWSTLGLSPNLNPITAVFETAGPNAGQLALGFADDITGLTGLKIVPNDPSIRTLSGGFVAADTFLD